MINKRVKELLNVEKNSIRDFNTIVEIGKLTTDFTNGLSDDEADLLISKIPRELHFGALYPHIHTDLSDIKPEKYDEL